MMTRLFDTLVSDLGLPATGIHPTADAGQKCLWTCTWRCKTPGDVSQGATDPSCYTPDDILPLENATQTQLGSELDDASNLYGLDMPEPMWGFTAAAEEAARLKLLVDAGGHYDEARRFLSGNTKFGAVREYAMSLRSYILPTLVANWPTGFGGQQRPGW
jgi:hypothetical protein